MSEEKSKEVGATEYEGEARDPESMRPLRTGLSWSSTCPTLVEPPDFGNEAIRIKGFGKWFSKWWWPSLPNIVADERIKRPPQLSTAQDGFIKAVLGALPSGELQNAYEWYVNFLESKITEAWENLFSQVLKNPGNCTRYPGADGFSSAFQMLEVVVNELTRERLALTDVVDKLYNKQMLRYTDSERSHANQLLFASIGWISCLYTANLKPASRKLQIMQPLEGSSGVARPSLRRRFQRDKVQVLTNYEQSLEKSDQPLHTMLSTFGNIIPRRQKEFFSEQKSPLPVKPEDEWIELSLLCFHTMTKLSGVKIEWVDSLCLHLEFDSYTKVLKLFRLPSICLLMCCCEKMSPLSQLFSDSAGSNDYLPIEVEDACHFYREVLLTYRLIFGQHKGSYKEFVTSTRKSFPLPEAYRDPLLPLLCGQSCETTNACQIYALIEADEPATRYDPLVEFPFFGKRMLLIQRYVRAHHPSMPYANWQNKSSTLAAWSNWFRNIATVIGVLTLLLAILQTILGILQVIYTKEQLH